jgi:hypothetical protein
MSTQAPALSSLDEIERIHDAEPERAAAALRVLDTRELDAAALGTASFLFAHVLGEKLGRWPEAAERIAAALASHSEPPPRALRNAAVAARLAGRAEEAHQWQARLASAAGARPEAAALVVDLHALAFTAAEGAAERYAEQLGALAKRAMALPEASQLDASLAAGLNNATSALLDAAGAAPGPAQAAALRAGAEAARGVWQRAGGWVQHERAEYLRALVLNRCGDAAGALAATQSGLALIAANGEEEVDRAFLLLQQAAAQAQLDERAAALDALGSARAIAQSWSDEGLRAWFSDELGKAPGLAALLGSAA